MPSYYRLQSVWKCTEDESPEMQLALPLLDLEETWPLVNGKRATKWNANLFLFCLTPDRQSDFPDINCEWHVASSKFRAVLEHSPNILVQYLPVRVRTVVGEALPVEYFVLNYLENPKVLDRNETQIASGRWSVDRDTGNYDVEVPVLNRQAIGERSVFRVYGWSPLVVYRSDVVEAMESAGLTGCSFTEIEVV